MMIDESERESPHVQRGKGDDIFISDGEDVILLSVHQIEALISDLNKELEMEDDDD